MLVCAYDRGVDHHVFVVGVIRQSKISPTLSKIGCENKKPRRSGAVGVCYEPVVSPGSRQNRGDQPARQKQSPGGSLDFCWRDPTAWLG